MKTRQERRLRLRDRLGRLQPAQAAKLLGEEGEKLIRLGARYTNIDLDKDVYLRGDLFRLTLRRPHREGGDVRVTITQMAERRNRLVVNCDACETPCEHAGAALALILDDKYSLGLSEIPKEGVPLELLAQDELVRRALAEREKRSRDEPFRLTSSSPDTPWTDYLINSGHSGKSYRVALRGEERGQSYCSCPDFRSNTLGTCKHIFYALSRIRSKFPVEVRSQPFRPTDFAVHLRYGEELTLWLEVPSRLRRGTGEIVGQLGDGPIEDLGRLFEVIRGLERAGSDVIIYPDAEQFIQRRLFRDRIATTVQEIRRDPANHPLRRGLLDAELLPYQLDGIAFAVGAGRAILADDMGLGKTIQGIGVAELLARMAEIQRVLVICPTSLKSQWCVEIGRFCERDYQLVVGSPEERAAQYESNRFFTICNYEQVLRDLTTISRVRWDLIVLDEGQRIKNWEAKTTNVIKGLESPFALVLSGTPLENRLEELYSIVRFIDDRRLPPAFRFFHQHRIVDEKGAILGYKNLDELRENLKPVLLRRTRQSVLQELPDRNTEFVRILPTEEQKRINDGNLKVVAQILSKKFISEMDLLRLQKALLAARMSADSTYLVNKEAPGYSTKLERLDELCEQLFASPDCKAVLFSEWTTMLDLIEPIVERHGIDFVRLDGSVPQKKRQQLVNRFQNNDECRLFITTNAGSTGLNLQAANTVINVDLPWNPAVLEQRISRAHRMGQRSPVDVYILVTMDTLEERMLETIADKRDLALAALDVDSKVTNVEFRSGMSNLKERLEVLLGSRPPVPQDRQSLEKAAGQIERFGAHRERVAAAGGEMLGAVFNFLNELVNQDGQAAPPDPLVSNVRDRLAQSAVEDEAGRPRLTLTLPNREALDTLARTLAALLSVGK